MMKDQLEEFIKKNRSQFDDREPSAQVWMGVKEAITPSISLWNSVMVWRAAAVIFMALSLYLLIPKNDNVQLANANAEENVLTDFQDVEKFYVTEISNKVSMINGFDVDNEGLNGYTQNFQQLEAMYMVLKEEMKTSPSVKVKEALVLNLLIQIDLLNKQLDKLDNGKEKEKSDEKIS
jgi:uncharacterized protein YfkK (UPF0435 family)